MRPDPVADVKDDPLGGQCASRLHQPGGVGEPGALLAGKPAVAIGIGEDLGVSISTAPSTWRRTRGRTVTMGCPWPAPCRGPRAPHAPRRRLRAIPVAFATPPPFRHRFDAAAAQPVTTGPPLERCTGPLPAFGAGAGRLPRCRPGGSGGGLASALALATAYRPVYFAGLNRNPVFVVLAHDPTVAAVCQLLMSTTAAQLDHSRSIGLTASVGSLTSSGLLPAVSARWPLRRGPGRERGRGARP